MQSEKVMIKKLEMPILIFILFSTIVIQILILRKPNNKQKEIIIIEREIVKPIKIKEKKD